MNWREKFQVDIQNKLRKAKEEYEVFIETQQVIYLQQAGNKLFSAIENYFMLKYKCRVHSYAKLRELIEENSGDVTLLRNAVQLHYFYYNADLQMDRVDASRLFAEVLSKFEPLVV